MRRVFVRLQRVGVPSLVLMLSAPVSTLAEDCRCNETRALLVARPLDADSAGAASRGLSNETVLDAMNDYRGRQRLPPLEFDRRLNAAAQDRVRDMFEQGYFDHIAPDGTSPFAAMRRRGYRYSSAAENLAIAPCSARAVVDGWIRSPGHRANILGDYEDAGIAILSGSPTYRTRGCTVVALFGRARS